MQLISWLTCAFTLVSTSWAADSTVYHDPETGFTFSQYLAQYDLGRSVTFRIAIPSGASANTPYDAVLQVVAPSDVGWIGLAWGGRMTNNPLTVSWDSGSSIPTVSSRYASTRTMPQPNPRAAYTILRTGTKRTSSGWQFTAKCSGCTSWVNQATGPRMTINPQGSSLLAFAYASAKPSNPSSNSSSFGVHDVHTGWSHDFAAAANAGFDGLVAKNL